MASKRGFISVQFEAIEPHDLVIVLEAIEQIIEPIEGASVEMNIMPERPVGLPMGRPPGASP